MNFLTRFQSFFSCLIALAFASTATAEVSKHIPKPIINNFVSFPVDDPQVGKFGNPDGLVIGPDHKLYLGFFGDFAAPTSVPKGIGRVSKDRTVELVSEFPMYSGFVEEMIFGKDGFLYVNMANSPVDSTLQTGIIKVDVSNPNPLNNFEQFYANPNIQLATGLTQDFEGNFYVADSSAGLIYKVDSQGNDGGGPWLDDPLLKGTNPSLPVGVDGLEFVQRKGKKRKKKLVIYAANFNQGLIVEIPVNRDGSPGKPSILIQDSRLISADALGVSPDKETLWASMLNTGTIAQINISKKKLHMLVDLKEGETNTGLGSLIQTIPAFNFEDDVLQTSLFSSNLGIGTTPGGNIWLLTPFCPDCSFWKDRSQSDEGSDYFYPCEE